MTEAKANKNQPRFFLFRGMSIQQRLPLLICLLLLSVTLTFGLASYYRVKNAALEVGKKRLRSVTDQVSSMFSQSIKISTATTHAAMQKDSIRDYLQTGDPKFKPGALAILQKLRKDSTWTFIELLNAEGKSILRSNEPSTELNIPASEFLHTAAGNRDSVWLGKIFRVKDSMYYPFVARLSEKKHINGFLVSWHILYSNQKNIDQLSQLMGPGITLFISNTDGSLWTNMVKPVSHPALQNNLNDFFDYTNPAGTRFIGAAQPLQSTSWMVSIEVPEKILLEDASRFLTWMILTGSAIIIAGIFLAWLMSRNITRPLNKLTVAASSITKGNYSTPVSIHRNDELGKLADAFNEMAVQVKNAQLHLEKKVSERTEALETAIKELEAFSYSVSHDLRAPLRGIIGFTTILEEEYSKGLGDEAKRITSIIKANTMKMGLLIDDLLTFSRMARQDITKVNVDTNQLVKEAVNEIGIKANKDIDWVIHPLPVTTGDPNAMRQVWINLISNAIKYSGKETRPRIEIGSFFKDGETVYFVKDNGVGFDQQYAGKLFKVFQRLHSGYEFEGTGVGLAIVEKIISKHGGKVWAEAEKDKGANFYFSLPAEATNTQTDQFI